METSKTTSYLKNIESISTEKAIAKVGQVFLDECLYLKTDIGKHELLIILKPKRFRRISFTDSSELTVVRNHSNELFTIIKHYLAQERCVEQILFLKKDDIFHIWTVISNYDNEENRKLIYKKEVAVMNFLSKLNFHFDFYLIEADEVSEVLSSGAVVIYSKV